VRYDVKHNGRHKTYLVAHISGFGDVKTTMNDDLMIASKDPESIIKNLTAAY